MKDNLSIIVTMLVFVILIVIFPLYNYFERQDDMSYNMVLKSTTNFVDEVVNCGYIDQQMYNNFIEKLAVTGNLYDIQLEAHKKTYTKDPYNLVADTYIEQYNIDYNSDIFDENTGNANNSNVKIDNKVLKNGVYHLNVGDQIYVKLKNSSTTMAGAIFNIIVPTSKKERLKVNYGGIIKNNAWEKQDISNLFQKDIYIDIYLDKTSTPGLSDKINGIPTFSMDQNKELKFIVKVINYDKSIEANISDLLKDNLKLTGFDGDRTLTPIMVSKNSTLPEWTATFNLDRITSPDEFFGMDFYKTCQAELEAGILQGNYFKNDAESSDTVTVKRSNLQNVPPDVSGPYLNGSASVVTSVEMGSTVVYYLNYYSASLIAPQNEIRNFLSSVDFSYNSVTVEHDISAKRFKLIFYNVVGQPNERFKLRVEPNWAQYLNVTTGTIDKVGSVESKEATFTLSPKSYTSPGIHKYVIPVTGRYKLDVIGANGGGNNNYISNRGSRGGKGGRTSGIISLTKGQVLYIVVGGVGKSAISGSSNTGGYNGGGNGSRYPVDSDFPNSFGFGGGGATDIRLSDTQIMSTSDGLSKRIIVAGGGGGSDDIDISGVSDFSGTLGGNDDGSGGFGGGGNNSGGYGFLNGAVTNGTKPGTLTSGFALGKGQNATSNKDLGGGGGGYYGGFASSSDSSNSGGGGGSGYYAPEFTDVVGINGANSSSSGDGSATITYLGR